MKTETIIKEIETAKKNIKDSSAVIWWMVDKKCQKTKVTNNHGLNRDDLITVAAAAIKEVEKLDSPNEAQLELFN